MATRSAAERRKTLAISNDPESGSDDVQQAESLTPEEEEYESFLAEVGSATGDATVHVHKLNVEGRDVRVWKGPPAQFDIDAIAKKFGSGDYRAMLYSRIESGQIVRRSHHVIPMLLSPEDDARIRAMREGKLPEAGSGFSLEMLTAAIKAAIPQQPTIVTPQNQLGLLKEMGEVLRSIMPQTMPAHAAAPAGITANDLLAAILPALLKRGGDDGDDEPIRGGKNAGGYDLLLRLVDRFAPTLQTALTGGAAGADAGAVALPAPAQANAAATTAASAPQQGDEMLQLKMGLAFLVEQAKRGNDAGTYADVILDNVGETEIRTLLGSANWLDQLAAFNPAVKEHAKWFGELKTAIETELNAPAE